MLDPDRAVGKPSVVVRGAWISMRGREVNIPHVAITISENIDSIESRRSSGFKAKERTEDCGDSEKAKAPAKWHSGLSFSGEKASAGEVPETTGSLAAASHE
jgi:hypothetical protein